MEFEYYTDEIILSENMDNQTEIPQLENFINSIQSNIDKENINCFYKRNKNGASILGIQLINGDINDINSYLIYDCQRHGVGNQIYCSVDVHASSKIISGEANLVDDITIISNGATVFFHKMERNIADPHMEYNYMKNYSFDKKKQNIFKRVFKKYTTK